MAEKKPKKPEAKNLESVSLGSGLAEQAKVAKVSQKNKNAAALAEAMKAVGTVEVNKDKKYNSQYGKGGK